MGQFFKMVLAAMVGFFLCYFLMIACAFVFFAISGGAFLSSIRESGSIDFMDYRVN